MPASSRNDGARYGRQAEKKAFRIFKERVGAPPDRLRIPRSMAGADGILRLHHVHTNGTRVYAVPVNEKGEAA